MDRSGSSAESSVTAPDRGGEPERDLTDVVVAMDRVTVRRNGTTLVSDVDWTVELDERWVVLGPNGAGKTTLLRLASAEMHPTSGVVHVLGERLGRVNVFELRTRIGLSSANLGLQIPGDELLRDIVVSAGYGVFGRWRENYDAMDTERADQLLDAMGMGKLADREWRTLSEGERKRTLIARALMTDPELLLLDEPAAGLDLGGREDLVGRLATLAADPDAPTSILVTHHVEEIPRGYSHGLLIREGTVVAAGLLDDVLTDENLTETFGLPLAVQRRRGRYTAWLK
ncbi:iron ABC transporter ATP-binding protein [Pseudonocardia sulfidoxydans NBRC 16205]|uniref:Iron ABC transporter ATP-binding protein n=1 Tax=Pseudonocardia sulfidoxydans NBRC 16205 TaxID=1223511 RepID=A0A511DJZ2_9PSEU|nr:iron ABC transporter ATP-binding protein [Pseudonocardia sulfidoxydans NBRC 16205]